MFPLSTVQPITRRLVQVHAIVEKIAGVNGPLNSNKPSKCEHIVDFLLFSYEGLYTVAFGIRP